MYCKRKRRVYIDPLKVLAAVAAFSVAAALGVTSYSRIKAEYMAKRMAAVAAVTADEKSADEIRTEEWGAKVRAVIEPEYLPKVPAAAGSKEPVEPAAEDHGAEEAEAAAAEAPVRVSMENCLFVGDSRTVGLKSYGQLEGAEFFAGVGLSIYQLDKAKVPVGELGQVSFEELLKARQYDKVYIMMGINEVGYPFEKTVERYRSLVERLLADQPGAQIVLQGNLHVTKERSDKDKVVNNPNIDRFNSALSGIADGERVFYIDPNHLFDDENGALDANKSYDNAHPKAQYYIGWSEWIMSRTFPEREQVNEV